MEIITIFIIIMLIIGIIIIIKEKIREAKKISEENK